MFGSRLSLNLSGFASEQVEVPELSQCSDVDVDINVDIMYVYIYIYWGLPKPC